MLIFKPPRIGGEVDWHQDATFLITDPPSVIGFWFALEDANVHNGCLWVEPEGHRGPLRQRLICEDGAVRMQTLDATAWPRPSQAVPLEVAAGTLVCLHGMLPHYSAANRSERSRDRLFLARVRRALRLVGAELVAARAWTTAARARSRGARRRGGAVTLVGR